MSNGVISGKPYSGDFKLCPNTDDGTHEWDGEYPVSMCMHCEAEADAECVDDIYNEACEIVKATRTALKDATVKAANLHEAAKQQITVVDSIADQERAEYERRISELELKLHRESEMTNRFHKQVSELESKEYGLRKANESLKTVLDENAKTIEGLRVEIDCYEKQLENLRENFDNTAFEKNGMKDDE